MGGREKGFAGSENSYYWSNLSDLLKGHCLYSYAGAAGDGNGQCAPPVNCGGFEVPNAVTTGESFYGGAGSHTACAEDYVMRGHANRTCQSDGTWDVPAPTCLWQRLAEIPDFQRNCTTWQGRLVSVRIPWEFEYEHEFDLNVDNSQDSTDAIDKWIAE